MKLKLILIMLLGLSGISEASGGMSTGGGAAAVCRDQNHKVISAQILDLYEGRVRYGYDIPSSSIDSETQILNAVSNLTNFDYYMPLVHQAVVDIIKSMRFLPEGVGLNAPSDLGDEVGVVVPEGCVIEAAGFYEWDGTLKISPAIYRALSPTDRSAFIMHEAIYKISRIYGHATDSALSRKLTAALYATNVSSADIVDLSPNVFDGSDYQWIHQLRKPAYIPGTDSYDLLTAKITTDSTVPYKFAFSCNDLSSDWGKEGTPVDVNGNGVFKFDASKCYSLSGRVYGINLSQQMNFKFEILYQDKVLYTINFEVDKRSGYESYPLGTDILHPDEALPPLPVLQ